MQINTFFPHPNEWDRRLGFDNRSKPHSRNAWFVAQELQRALRWVSNLAEDRHLTAETCGGIKDFSKASERLGEKKDGADDERNPRRVVVN